MKKFNRLVILVSVFIVFVIVIMNIIIISCNKVKDLDKLYRVEINRIEEVIKNEGYDKIDLSKYQYIINVFEFNLDDNDAYTTNNEYYIVKINDKLYRFEYDDTDNIFSSELIISNIIVLVFSIFIILILLYIKNKVIKPGELLVNVPYELSKGNLIKPIKEEKNAYFGKMFWGMDMLRENIEGRKAHELELEKEKKTLLMTLAHDVKTPLSAIKLYSQAISKGLYDDKEKQIEVAKSINQKSDEIVEYINKMIKSSNEDLFDFDIKNEEFYLDKLMNHIKDYYQEKLDLINTSFNIEKFDNALIKGDFDRSVEVIQNLIENAIKYGDGKMINISIKEEESCKLISIENSGKVLEEKEIDHLFDSFFRGSNAKDLPGSGLGLYIARKLMRKMNGEIFAESKENKMVFTLVFLKA